MEKLVVEGLSTLTGEFKGDILKLLVIFPKSAVTACWFNTDQIFC